MGSFNQFRKQPATQPTQVSIQNPYHFRFLKSGTLLTGTDTPLFQKQLRAAKLNQPILHLNEGPGLKWIAFDWDSTDPVLHAKVWKNFSSFAAIFKSPSGNIKALVPVAGYASKELSREVRVAYIKDTLKKVDMEGYMPDCTDGALNFCFLSATAVTSLEEYLSGGMPILGRQVLEELTEGVAGEGSQHKSSTIVKQTSGGAQTSNTFKYFQSTRDTFSPEIMAYIRRTTRGTQLRLKLIQILVRCYNLAGTIEGFGLSSKVIAEQIGCSHTFVLSEFRYLESQKWLECVDEAHHYKKGIAKKYLADGILEKEVYKEKKDNPRAVRDLPTSIPDGRWNEMLLPATWKFNTKEAYMAWFYSLPGWAAKADRESKAISIASWHFKRLLLRGLYSSEE